jgi:hypothetical protein
MSTQKILTINPDAFKFPSKRKTFKERKIKPVQNANQALKSNKLKKELLKKVKDYQKNKEVEKMTDSKLLEAQAPNLFDANSTENGDFEREFNKSLTFLHDLSKKNKEKKKKKTLKVSNLDVHIDIPSDNLIYTTNKEPNYGCLKNGSKPTFRDLVKTKKNNNCNKDRLQIVLEKNKYYDHAAFYNKYNNEDAIPCIAVEEPIAPHNPQIINESTNNTTLSNNENKESDFIAIFDNKNKVLNAIDRTLNNEKKEESNSEANKNNKHISYNFDNPKELNVNTDCLNEPKAKGEAKSEAKSEAKGEPDAEVKTEEFKYNEAINIPKLCITTKTYKYKLGRNKEKRQIGVLIKNRDTQKRIKKEVENLKQQDIQTIKNYLREKGLIKLGSQAPTAILRKMYEDSILSGEINNNNSNNLVFNYLNN